LRKITVKDIAREAGVSTATISRVLNNSGYVSGEVRRRVQEVVKKYNYQPNSIARSLKQNRSRAVGLVVPDMTNPYFMAIARRIQTVLFAAGYHLLLMDSEDDPVKERRALAFFMEQRVEALVIASTGRNRENIEAIRALGIHVVLIDRRIDGLDLDIVAEDSRKAAEEAVAMLLAKGHRRIGVINGPLSVATARERSEGVAAACSRFGVRLDPSCVVEGDFTRKSGTEAIMRLMRLPFPPTAIFSANNEMTYGLYLGLHALGMSGDAVEVVSFGELEFSPLFRNRLTVIRQDPHALGNAAGELLIKRLEGRTGESELRLFMPRLVVEGERGEGKSIM